MFTSELKVIKLACVGCGANLDISMDMRRLACGFCGTQQTVERTGGAVHLRSVAEAIAKVQVGTDKTAAELAIVRLTKELERCKAQRAAEEQKYRDIRTKKLYDWNEFLNSKAYTVNVLTLIAAICSAIPVGILCRTLVYGIASLVASTAEGAATFAVFVFLAGCAASSVFIRYSVILKSDKFNPEKLQADCTKDIKNLDRTIAQSLSPYDKEIAALNAKIQQNYEIANS